MECHWEQNPVVGENIIAAKKSYREDSDEDWSDMDEWLPSMWALNNCIHVSPV